ncbi:MAG: ACT domain-containing protein [Candidatus Methanomethylophilaceae archaeon]
MILEFLDPEFSICKLLPDSKPDIGSGFVFLFRTDDELSIVCRTVDVPCKGIVERNDGWRAFRVVGKLDFSLIGVLSRITGILADNGIGVFVVSTFDTDYILVRDDDVSDTRGALSDAGYGWREATA